MSPYLFALFLNDLENFMENKNSTGLNTITEDIDTALVVYISCFALLNADDTVRESSTCVT
jgi:ABC-type lipoprotein release transport system permease subunit